MTLLQVLAPAEWGTEPAPWAGSLGLPARRDVVEALRQQQLGVLRIGGTMCNVDGYRWKLFRGPRELRHPYRGYWYEEKGLTQSRSFGMFEIVDLCQAIDCEPVITLNLNETADDMGDFVEYCWGNTSTPWGAIRAADGHPEPYRVSIVEIGNEVETVAELCPKAVVPIVRAMDKRAEAVGAPPFSYVIGYNVWGEDVQDGTARRAALDECLDATASLGDRAYCECPVFAIAARLPVLTRVRYPFCLSQGTFIPRPGLTPRAAGVPGWMPSALLPRCATRPCASCCWRRTRGPPALQTMAWRAASATPPTATCCSAAPTWCRCTATQTGFRRGSAFPLWILLSRAPR